ncbi:ABC transporter ATP-binding protein [Streptomyces hoynatensis]|uniref:ABC transporter ATP-binding protein n=1 Tax=Streptomyces hoynatensis TaxID=1141874 RepID=A0A3A9ZAT0_9ACTN|nr:ABC transporter ATP-binding protein [Streptomyces hoynatensis]RKN44904.1 ABC transporter ATP-binding protein [Streptomyces hoynatensis]
MRNSLRMTRHTLALSFRADRKVTLAVAVLVALQAGLVSLTALSQRRLVDAAGLNLASGVLGAVLLGAACFALQTVGQRISVNLRNDLCNRVQLALEQEIAEAAAGIPTIAHLERNEFVNRVVMLRRGTLALTNTGWAAAYALSATAGIAMSVWLLAGIHPLLALLALSAVPILPLTNRAKRMQQEAADATVEDFRQEAALHELCLRPHTAKEVWVSGNGPRLDEHANALWARGARHEARARMRGLGHEIGGWVLYCAALAAALAWIGRLLRTGGATPGDAVLVISLAGQLRAQQQLAVDTLTQVANGGRIAEHHRWLLDYARTARGGRTPAPTRLRRGIELHDVSFTYPGATAPALSNVSLTIPRGTSLGIAGANGAGKSTLVKLLTGVHHPTSGRITVDGVDLRELDPGSWAAVCTGVLQDFLKLQTPLRESVGAGHLPDLHDGTRVAAALGRAHASRLAEELPHGLETQLGKTFGGAELSHGQWQRVALGRGFMRRAPLFLLLDEPTAALDPQAEHELYELFLRQTRESAGRGAVTALVSHRFSTIHTADLIVVVGDGRITEQGTHEELLSAGGEYAELYRTQLRAYR